jgi:hypothetical protein
MAELEKHHFLLIIRVDIDPHSTTSPLRLGTDAHIHQENETAKPYYYFAGILQPSGQSKGAPVTFFHFNPQTSDRFNAILRGLRNIDRRYFAKDGFVARPASYNEKTKRDIFNEINSVGSIIYHMLRDDIALANDNQELGDWLSTMLKPASVKGVNNITIITNDFNIPWYWMKMDTASPFLCEKFPVGTVRPQPIAPPSKPAHSDAKKSSPEEYHYMALLINGAAGLPCAAEELAKVQIALSGTRIGMHKVGAKQYDDAYALGDFAEHSDNLLLDQVKIVHFTGRHSADRGNTQLFLGGRAKAGRTLKELISGSLLVLDGCSISRGEQGLRDIDLVANEWMKLGPLGCVMPVLPIKHDPIIAEVFWNQFYLDVRSNASVGKALNKAREFLRDHFRDVGFDDPTWLSYQLAGNPSVRLIEDEEPDDDHRGAQR